MKNSLNQATFHLRHILFPFLSVYKIAETLLFFVPKGVDFFQIQILFTNRKQNNVKEDFSQTCLP